MCAVSFVGDHYHDRWFPHTQPPLAPATTTVFPGLPGLVTQVQLDALREELLEAIDALRAAVLVDRVTNQPDCSTDEKLELLRRVADALGLGEELETALAGD